MLQSRGISAAAYHAGLENDIRADAGEIPATICKIVVVTVAFGMGINKPNVRFVVHLISRNIESIIKTGRAGVTAAGGSACCFTISGYGGGRAAA